MMKAHFLKLIVLVATALSILSCGEDKAVSTVIPTNPNPVPSNSIALRANGATWGSSKTALNASTDFRKVLTTELGTNAWLVRDTLYIKGLNAVNGDTQTIYFAFRINPNSIPRTYSLRFDNGSVDNNTESIAFFGWRRQWAIYVPSIANVGASINITKYDASAGTLNGTFSLQQQLGEDPITVVTNGLLQDVVVRK